MPVIQLHPNHAHNGYIETYFNLGSVGLFLLIGLIIVTFHKCRKELLETPEWGRMTMSYLVAILAHNWTEAGFKGLSVMFFVFYLILIKYPKRITADSTAMYGVSSPTEEDWKLIHC